MLRCRADPVLTLAASVAAVLAGWAVDALLDPWLDAGPEMLVSLAVTTMVFVVVRQWLKRLRDG